MQTARIPWRIFFDALADQSRSKLEVWLLGWRFGNEGVYVAERKSRFSGGYPARKNLVGLGKQITSSKGNGRHELG